MNLFSLLKNEISLKEFLNYYNANIFYKDLPSEVNGYVFQYREINCIIINENISYYKKRKTLLHELAHIELNQLNQIDNDLFEFKIDKYEDEADTYVKFLLESIKVDL